MAEQDNWLAVDFGTCNTAAAFLVGGVPHTVTYGNTQLFPTVACVLPDGQILVCGNAEVQRDRYPEYFKQEFKLGIADPADINGCNYEDIVAEILTFVRHAAELDNNGTPHSKVLLTVPAVYTATDSRKEVMRRAAERAGFVDVEFMPEPHAAALHFAWVNGATPKKLTLVYDLGGGTFDPVLVDTSVTTPRILGEGGADCGGQFFDADIYRHISGLMREAGKPLKRADRLADYRACRQLKETLSVEPQATQVMSNGETVTLTRDTFNELIRPRLRLTFDACDHVISTAGRSWADVGQVLFVGGSTAIPLIGEMLGAHMRSHNAGSVRAVRTLSGSRGSYSHLFATCLGAITSKIGAGAGGPAAALLMGTRRFPLHDGLNSFGRADDCDNTVGGDPSLSRLHFTVEAERGADGMYVYTLRSLSQSSPTMLNGTEALDPRFVPFCRDSAKIRHGDEIKAGNSVFILEAE